MQLKVLFRTNLGPTVGYGHFSRCFSLAKACQKMNWNCSFIVNEVSREGFDLKNVNLNFSRNFDKTDLHYISSFKPDVVVFDSYGASNEYVKELANRFFLVQFDDNNDLYSPIYSKVLVNGNLYAKELQYIYSPDCQLKLLGCPYLVMKEEYWSRNLHSKQGNYILVTTGGGDTYDLSIHFAESLRTIPYRTKIVIGPFYEPRQIEQLERVARSNHNLELIYKPSSLKEHIAGSMLVLTSSGSTVYEVLRMRKKLIVFEMADNQTEIARSLEKKGVINLGWHKNICLGTVAKLITSEVQKEFTNNRNLESLYTEFDGQGASRVADSIRKEVMK